MACGYEEMWRKVFLATQASIKLGRFLFYFSQKKNVFSWGKREKVYRKLGVKSALILFIKTNLTNKYIPNIKYIPNQNQTVFPLDSNITVLETGKYDFKSAETTEHSFMLYSNTAAEKCYCVTRKELLAIVK